MVFKFGNLQIVVPKHVNYKSKNIYTLTKTNLPTRRQGNQSIRLNSSSSIRVPIVKLNVDKNSPEVGKLVEEVTNKIETDKKTLDKLKLIEDKQKVKHNSNYDAIIKMVYSERQTTGCGSNCSRKCCHWQPGGYPLLTT